MKLHLSILKNLIELPSQDSQELRKVLDDLGLEVKAIEEISGQTVFNIETLANRGDHLSALGVARELSSRFLTPITFPKLSAEFSALKNSVKLNVNTNLCSRIALLEASLGNLLLRPEVKACFGDGIHPDTPIVDLCNYLYLELGNCVHAFDMDKVEGEFFIEELKQEEKVIALDGKEYTVPKGAIVGRDRNKILIVSGIIGCQNSMVTSKTKRFLIESAFFDPVSIRKTARAMGISTDASYAFERGVDREAVLTGLRRLVALSSGSSGEGLNVHALSYFEGSKTEKREVALSFSQVKNQLNLPKLNEVEILSRLKALGYQVNNLVEKESCNLAVPAWRLFDVEKEADIIEDVARSISLSQVKLQLPLLDYAPPAPSNIEELIYALEYPLHGLGFQEVMTKNLYSNDEVSILERLEPESRDNHVVIKNALEKSCSHLKITNLIHCARLIDSNLKRGVNSIKVYENARLFRRNFKKAGHPYESELDILSIAFAGRITQNDFRKQQTAEESFYWFKGVIESCFESLKIQVEFVPSAQNLLHPSRQIGLNIENSEVGFFGQINPELSKLLDVNQPFLYAELDTYLVAEFFAKAKSEVKQFSDYPRVQRDFTLKVPSNSFAEEVIKIVENNKVENLTQSQIVDDFKRSNEDFRRISYRFTFQSSERTLTSAEVDQAMNIIRQELEVKGFGLAD